MIATGFSSHFLAEILSDEVPEDDPLLGFFCGGATFRKFGELEFEIERIGFLEFGDK